MTGLLDTHTVLWAATSVTLLSARVRAILADEDNDLLISAATAWEIATKVRLGRLPLAEALERDFVRQIEGAGYRLLNIDTTCALRAARLIAPHQDPFDRMIAAHALQLDIPVLSIDQKLDQFGVRRIW